MILAKVEQIRRSHRRNKLVEVLAFKRYLRRSNGRFQPGCISQPGGATVKSDLLVVYFQNFIQGQKKGFHQLLLREFLERL